MNEDEAELLLFDRIAIIKDTVAKYGEDKFYIAFSGGKDSTVLHHLVDLAVPNNKIPRVFTNTGIEYVDIVKFVRSFMAIDDRFKMIMPSQPIHKIWEEKGYPFKSKEHSKKLNLFQNGSKSPWLDNYLDEKRQSTFKCPKVLRYQFEKDFTMKISDQCCNELKKKPSHKWQKENHKTIVLTGMRNEEGGQRKHMSSCVIKDKDGNVIKFHPLLKVNEEWEEWFIAKQHIQLCSLYYPPYNFKRTGCKGCPYSLNLQEQLETMAMFMPKEWKQCENIWKPVYTEMRRIGYRLKPIEGNLFQNQVEAKK